MWQADTFDPVTIDRELGYAENIGFNTMRVFLHSLAWNEDPKGFRERVNKYLTIADKHHIQTIFVFFDDCWNANPKPGKQPDPKPGIHNSGWMQDPGRPLTTEADFLALKAYVDDVLNTFKHDNRVLLWDLYNEPGNSNKNFKSADLLTRVFAWARAVNPDQPLSVGFWDTNLKALCKIQIENSDVITYHNYDVPAAHMGLIVFLKQYGRPLICTEYMARPRNSTFQNTMPLLKKENIGAINWGFVSGKTNTIYAWDTPMPDGSEPKVWFHDIFRKDGSPYKQEEVAFILLVSCHDKNHQNQTFESQYPKGSFGYDLNFLRRSDSVIVLNSKDGNGQVIVSPKYQAKVFTSTADGLNGKSFGWINYETFAATSLDAHMNAYGGEDRLWLGPEGGKFALFFKPHRKMEFANWHTPTAFDFESWKLTSHTDKKASLSKSTRVMNYAGIIFNLAIVRDIEILEPADVKKLLGIDFDSKIKLVAFSTTNTIVNTSYFAWDKQTGAPCLWNLDMFSPSAKTVVVVPYNNNNTGKIATTDYFGQIPPDRVKYNNGILLFKADGKSRGKLGMPPNRAKTLAGSYDAENNVLTIALFDLDPKATYLNQEWRTDKNPFTGDAVNAYNDGPLANGSQMGPFYEIESVSPAAFLKPNEGLTHKHSVFHFSGDKDELNQISLKTLGISLQDIQVAFK
jgi:hypothetical protein